MPKIFFFQHQNMELIVEGGKPRGGAAVQTMVWMQAFHELGFEVFLAKFENDERKLLPEFDWITPISIYHPDKNKKRLTWFTHRFPAIYRALKQSKCDYLYISIPKWITFFLGLMCKKLGVKKIIRIPNDNILDERIYFDHKKFEAFFVRQSLKFSDITLAQNDFQLNQLKLKYPKSKVYKIFNPIVIDQKFLKVKEYSIEGYIAWIANFRYQKNLFLLFKIARHIPGINFKVAGAPVLPLDKETEENLDRLKNLPNVELMGVLRRNEILPFLSKANFILNTSRYEGFSNTFLEAMMTGTPILTTQNVNPDGIIDSKELGYIFKNETELGEILKFIANSDYSRKSLNCLRFLKENHDHIELGKRVIEILTK
jgi:glycosyltransferase involved in cell wall biosynthesis